VRLLGNIIWLIFGGFFTAVEYLISSIILMITIVGIPFGLQTLKLASLALWPFGSRIEYMDYAPGCLSTVMNIIWLIIGGIWICLTHLIFGILLSITIIGIPFARQHFKLASLALTPFGRKIVYK
jgi:uncharacterized membrane protein YccF (DUF307 family)